MTQETTFLVSIAVSPNDTALRLVYADWLDERGDPRGELVRIQEEMRQLPVFSDRYWHLKPRRNELLAETDEGWLVFMRYQHYCHPVFAHGIPESVKERWRLIREFTERWSGGTLGDVGGRTKEIHEVETRLGRTLPPSIREWVAFANDLIDNPRYDEVLRDVYQMEELEEHAAVSLMIQGEGDYYWAVRNEDFGFPDPPVYGFRRDRVNQAYVLVPDERNPIADRVSSFALQHMIVYTPSAAGGFWTSIDSPEKMIRDLTNTLPVQFRLGGFCVFEKDNVIVHFEEGPRIYLTLMVAHASHRGDIPVFLRKLA